MHIQKCEFIESAISYDKNNNVYVCVSQYMLDILKSTTLSRVNYQTCVISNILKSKNSDITFHDHASNLECSY